MIDLSPDHLLRLRLHAQCLHPRLPRALLAEAARAVCGLQAQQSAAMMLQLRARVEGLTAEDVERAIARDRSLVRTWAMRGTLHLLPAEDVRWIMGLLGPMFAAKDQRRRLELGFDNDTAARGLDALRDLMSGGEPLTRDQIFEGLSACGVAIDRKSQALAHLVGFAAMRGILCCGPDAPNGKATYALLDRWVAPGEPVEREAALTELARRYLAGFGPADVRDFAAWSGLTMADAKAGWNRAAQDDRWVEAHFNGRALSMLAAQADILSETAPREPTVRLLPAFDTVVLGYAARAEIVAAEYQADVYHGGQTVPVVLVDGAAAGVWRYAQRVQRKGKRLDITVRAFAPFSPAVRDLIAGETEDIGRLWGMAASLTIG